MRQSPRYRPVGQLGFAEVFVRRPLHERPHFLQALGKLIDWEEFTQGLIELYKGRGKVGPAPYNPVLLLKMLFLSYLYGISERQTEEFVADSLHAREYLGLSLEDAVPDHSSLTKFKNRLLQKGNWQALERVFDGILAQARARGVQLGSIQVVDSVHTVDHVNHEKDQRRQEQGQPPRDGESTVVHKGKRAVLKADGSERVEEVSYRGYKSHISLNAATGLVTSVIPDWGRAADNRAFPQLLEHDLALRLPMRSYAGDKAYDDTDIHERLRAAGLHSGITLRRLRTHKRDGNKERWLALLDTPEYQAAVALRYRVEQPFGTAKQCHGFGRCRYLGRLRYGIQSFMTFMVVNCKRIVKLLTGITFRPQAKGTHAEDFTPVYANLEWA